LSKTGRSSTQPRPTVNGQYSYKGILKNASGQSASHSDMSAYADETGAYFIPRVDGSIRWLTTAIPGSRASSTQLWNGPSGGGEAPTVVQGGQHLLLDRLVQDRMAMQQQLLLHRTGHDRAVDLPGICCPSYRHQQRHLPAKDLVVADHLVQPVVGSKGTVYLYWGDHWDNCGATSGAGSTTP